MKAAVARIAAFTPVLARSRIYETAPVGPPQPEYLNAAVLIDWSAELLELLDRLQQIENDLGRIRAERWGARTIDLDILWTDGPPVTDARLVVPHPRLLERAFALLPLVDLLHGAPPQTPRPPLRRGEDAAPPVAFLHGAPPQTPRPPLRRGEDAAPPVAFLHGAPPQTPRPPLRRGEDAAPPVAFLHGAPPQTPRPPLRRGEDAAPPVALMPTDGVRLLAETW